MRRVKFSADGVRGVAGEWPLTPQPTRRIGCALGQFLLRRSRSPVVMIGRDTRPSGNVLASSLKAGLLSQGVDVIDLGIMTTPGIAYLTKRQQADLGVIVSASHNPLDYNGIKLVGPNGLRLQREEEIEGLINEFIAKAIESDTNPGQQVDGQHLIELYIQDQVRLCPFKSLKNLRLVLDCANGAASRVAAEVFARLGAEAIAVNKDLAGHNINDQCGSEHARQNPQDLIEAVRHHIAAYGFAFDGDGDRLVIVDKDGRMYNGDDFLFVLAAYFRNRGELRGEAIVTTNMVNTGLKKALDKQGIRVELTEHGDKNLEAKIWGEKYLLGSEQVGNVIINDGKHAAADPLYAALILSGIMHYRGGNELHELLTDLQKWPQVLASVHVAHIVPLEEIESLRRHEEQTREALGDGSRVLKWYSSTEPGLFKIMVEGSRDKTLEEVKGEAVSICRAVQQATGSQVLDPTVLDLSSRNCGKPACSVWGTIDFLRRL